MVRDIPKLLICAVMLFLTVCLCAQDKKSSVTEYSLKVEKTFVHDRNAYTQGLFFHEGRLFESTGQWGESSFREVNIASGDVLSVRNYPKDVFIEGSCVLDGCLYVLTWTNHKCYMYDLATMTKLTEFHYPGEGWGLTTDGRRLIMSDGSSEIFFLNPATFKRTGSVKVKMDGRDVLYLNELEYIDGRIWANIYTQDYIVIINPESGAVEGRIDCRGLLPSALRTDRTDVLNGIAHNPADGGIYITGKNWPRLYRVSLIENRKH